MENSDKRLIEDSFPVKEVSIESAKEKNIRHGHISTFHIWWARRPLSSSRVTEYAALVPIPKNYNEWQKQRNFIIELSKWENSNNPVIIEKAKNAVLRFNNGIPPKVLDPFGGGGSIPLEALRLGCETYSNDYNPVAVLVQKCTLEYPLLFSIKSGKNGSWGELSDNSNKNPLINDIKKWSLWVYEEAKKEIEPFYLNDSDGSTPMGYIWSRTIPCQNPSCGKDIPLIKQYWLSNKTGKRIALYPYIDDSELKFKIVGDGYEKIPTNFDPNNGTISKAIAVCPCCGNIIDANSTKNLFRNGKSKQKMIAVIFNKPNKVGKFYRTATEADLAYYLNSEKYLDEKVIVLRKEWGIEPIPDEPTPEGKGRGAERAFNLRNYGIDTWGDLFNTRQKLALITFVDKVRKVYPLMVSEGYQEEYAKAVASYLSLGIDKLVEACSSNCRWKPDTEQIIPTLSGRQTLSIMWDYVELNCISGVSRSWNETIDVLLDSFRILFQSKSKCVITNMNATTIPYSDNYFDAVFTDPPYYDNVPYSYLSDFFYVWLKRAIGNLYPDLFSTLLTPKKNEIVAYSNMDGGWERGKQFFEDMLKKSFQEIHRVLKPNGIAVIVYAHKSNEGWETLINSLLDSGLIVTGAWPLNTEMANRLRASESAALASSIYIVTRKMDREPTGFYNQIKEELKNHLNKKLDTLWKEGISGADFFIASIGSGIEIYGKYEQVMDYEGNIVRANRLLEDVRKLATDYAVKQILHNGFAGEISDLARFYVLWRWNYGEVKVPFDEARKLGQSCGIDVAHEWGHSGFVRKDKEFVKVLGPQDRKLEELTGSRDLIDVLHRVLLFWEKSRRDEMLKVLQESGFGNSEAFYRVAQAISETLPIESKEKKLLDGFLAGRERLREEVRKELVQTKLNT